MSHSTAAGFLHTAIGRCRGLSYRSGVLQLVETKPDPTGPSYSNPYSNCGYRTGLHGTKRVSKPAGERAYVLDRKELADKRSGVQVPMAPQRSGSVIR